jgi:dolichol-phosphate mannosyltransferase
MVVDLSAFAALSRWVLPRTPLAGRSVAVGGRPLELIWVASAALAIAMALSWNFALNRRLTFSDRRAGSLPAQFLTYVLSNALAVSLSFLLRLGLPMYVPFFAAHRLTAAVVGIVAATGVSFTLARAWVFRGGGARP